MNCVQWPRTRKHHAKRLIHAQVFISDISAFSYPPAVLLVLVVLVLGMGMGATQDETSLEVIMDGEEEADPETPKEKN